MQALPAVPLAQQVAALRQEICPHYRDVGAGEVLLVVHDSTTGETFKHTEQCRSLKRSFPLLATHLKHPHTQEGSTSCIYVADSEWMTVPAARLVFSFFSDMDLSAAEERYDEATLRQVAGMLTYLEAEPVKDLRLLPLTKSMVESTELNSVSRANFAHVLGVHDEVTAALAHLARCAQGLNSATRNSLEPQLFARLLGHDGLSLATESKVYEWALEFTREADLSAEDADYKTIAKNVRWEHLPREVIDADYVKVNPLLTCEQRCQVNHELSHNNPTILGVPRRAARRAFVPTITRQEQDYLLTRPSRFFSPMRGLEGESSAAPELGLDNYLVKLNGYLWVTAGTGHPTNGPLQTRQDVRSMSLDGLPLTPPQNTQNQGKFKIPNSWRPAEQSATLRIVVG